MRLFALALLIATGYGVNKGMKSNADLSDLALANVEALAQNENDPPSYNCPEGRTECVRVIRGNEVHIFYKS